MANHKTVGLNGDPVRVGVKFSPSLCRRLDDLGAFLHLNRSEVVRLLVEEGLERREKGQV